MRACLALVLAVACSAPAQAATTANLLKDPGAELGLYGDWETQNGFVVEQYGAEFRPPVSASQAINGGASVFAGGSDSTQSSATQTVDVSEQAAAIDAGRVVAQLSGYLGGLDQENDYATLTATFLPGGTTATIPPVTAADRGYQTALLLRRTERTLPAGTRSIQVTVAATRVDGVYTDGYADNLSLVLTGAAERRKGSVTGIKSPGRRIKGQINATGPCKSGRKVTVKKGAKTVGSARTNRAGAFNVKTKKHKKGKLTVNVRSRTTATVICAPIKKTVPGRH